MRLLARLLEHVAPPGRAVIGLGVLSWLVGDRFRWTELTVLSYACGILALLGLVGILLPRRARVALSLHPVKTVVGTPSQAELTVAVRFLPLLNPVVELPVGDTRARLRLPVVTRRRPQTQRFTLPAHRRGVFPVGPVANIQSDLLGLFRRRRSWAPGNELYVRPQVTLLESLATGVVNDLEGVPSEQLAASDLAFHALREYVPGDDLRHVHWRSSAKADRLLVRQYLETRRSHATVVVDDNASSYADPDDFELAVSIAASIALRAVLDDFEVSIMCGEVLASSTSVDPLLDACCRFAHGRTSLAEQSVRAAHVAAGTSFVALITGGLRDGKELHVAGLNFPVDAHRVVLRAEAESPSRLSVASGLRSVDVSELDHLAPLLWRTGS